MRRRGYAIAFALVLLLACVGGFFGGRLLLERLQQDFVPRPGWTPQLTEEPATGEATAPPAAPATVAVAQPRPTATTLVVATPTGVPPVQAKPSDTPPPAAATPGAGTAQPEETETASPTPSPHAAFAYALAQPVRHTTGDCPGVYVLGLVTDRAGNSLPNIRLKLVDEYGNLATAVSKSGQDDLGRYDFPLSGPPRRFYLTVVDEAGGALSAEIEIRHGLEPDAEATCHWVDWRRQ